MTGGIATATPIVIVVFRHKIVSLPIDGTVRVY